MATNKQLIIEVWRDHPLFRGSTSGSWRAHLRGNAFPAGKGDSPESAVEELRRKLNERDAFYYKNGGAPTYVVRILPDRPSHLKGPALALSTGLSIYIHNGLRA